MVSFVAVILVYGWYGHRNLGDELMRHALQSILGSEHQLIFVDVLREDQITKSDLLIIGGGSFLNLPLNVNTSRTKELLHHHEQRIVYVGVGAETDVHPDHIPLLARASYVNVRSEPSRNFSYVRGEFYRSGDLTDTLPNVQTPQSKQKKTLLYVPNSELLPDVDSKNWVRASWDYYRSEITQALDELVALGWHVTFVPICDDPRRRDEWAASEIQSFCRRRSDMESIRAEKILTMEYARLLDFFGEHELIVSQRYHGVLLANKSGCTSISIHHHDKLKNATGASSYLNYYGFNKHVLLNAVENAKQETERTNYVDVSLISSIKKAIKEALNDDTNRTT